MRSKTKKIVIFIEFFILLLMLFSVLTNFILPIKTSIISIDIGRYTSGDILFYSESESYNINDYILYNPSSKEMIVIAEIIEINSDDTFKVIGADPEPKDDLDQNNLKQEQIIGKVIYSVSWYIYYPMVITIIIILSLILTYFIYKKIK
jgi:hypothetical protein